MQKLCQKPKPCFARLKCQFETQLDFAKNPKDLTKQTPNGLRYLRWERGRRSRPARKRLRRRKRLGMCAESPASGARLVRWLRVMQEPLPKNRTTPFVTWFYTRHNYLQAWLCHWKWYRFAKTQSRELAETFAKNWPCEKFTLPEKTNLAKKA